MFELYGDELARRVTLRVEDAVADLTTLAGLPTARLRDGSMCIVGTGTTTETAWIFVATSTVASDATHQRPSDYTTAGVWYQLATTPYVPGTGQGEIQHVTIDVPLATLQGKTSTTPFNIGAALPANAQLVAPVSVNLIQALAGGTVSAATLTVQNTAETAGALLASTNVFTGAALARSAAAGSNPQPVRGGQQLQATVTTTGDTMAHLTAGHFAIELFYAVVP